MVDKTPLQRLLEDYRDTYGLERVRIRMTIQNLLQYAPEDQLASQIKRLTDPSLFNLLWGCGLSARLQEVALERWKELAGKGE